MTFSSSFLLTHKFFPHGLSDAPGRMPRAGELFAPPLQATDINLLFPKSTADSFARNRNHKLQTSKAPLKSQAQGTSLFTSAASNQRGFPKNSPWEAQVRLPEGERIRR